MLPLVTGAGAGAEMRNPLGVAVFSGMMGVTGFGLLLTPVFYVVIRGLVERRAGAATPTSTAHDLPVVPVAAASSERQAAARH